jgi:hypothetical protein
MKTLFNVFSKRIPRYTGSLAIIALLALGMVAATFPQPALAAGATTAPCVDYYIVKNKDTKGSIAESIGFKWWQIAAANNMLPAAKLVVGKRLCIPTKEWVANAHQGTMTAAATGKELTVKMSDFSARSTWNVKVKDATGGVTSYFKVGRIIATQKGSVIGVYNLPQDLLKTPMLKVCVTNAGATQTICTVIKHGV